MSNMPNNNLMKLQNEIKLRADIKDLLYLKPTDQMHSSAITRSTTKKIHSSRKLKGISDKVIVRNHI